LNLEERERKKEMQYAYELCFSFVCSFPHKRLGFIGIALLNGF
jgi:hypothetical protein